MADEATAEETEQGAGANDEEDVELLLEALMVGIPPTAIESCKNSEPPDNILWDIGTSRNPTLVNKSHIKHNCLMLREIAKRFPSRLPSKPACRMACEQLDAKHDNALSHARKRGQKVVQGDVKSWARDHGECLKRILSRTWKLRCKSSRSNDEDLQLLKDLFSPRKAKQQVGAAGPLASVADEAPESANLASAVKAKEVPSNQTTKTSAKQVMADSIFELLRKASSNSKAEKSELARAAVIPPGSPSSPEDDVLSLSSGAASVVTLASEETTLTTQLLGIVDEQEVLITVPEPQKPIGADEVVARARVGPTLRSSDQWRKPKKRHAPIRHKPASAVHAKLCKRLWKHKKDLRAGEAGEAAATTPAPTTAAAASASAVAGACAPVAAAAGADSGPPATWAVQQNHPQKFALLPHAAWPTTLETAKHSYVATLDETRISVTVRVRSPPARSRDGHWQWCLGQSGVNGNSRTTTCFGSATYLLFPRMPVRTSGGW